MCLSVLRIFWELGTIEKYYLIIVCMSSSEPELEALEYWSASSGLEDGMTLGEVSKSISRSESGTLKIWSVSGWEDGITEKNCGISWDYLWNKGEIRYGIRG